MDDENEIWDEFKWEEFMKEQDKKVDRYMELFYRYQDNPDRDEIIAREMGWTWLLKDELDDEFSSALDDHEDEVEEGEYWKKSAGINQDDTFDLHAYRNLPVYQKAKEFALKAFRFVERLPEVVREDSTVVDFVSSAMIASAKIVGGMCMGEDIEELGANIAYCKRGLNAANVVISALYEMQQKSILKETSYSDLIRDAVEVRNAIAIHILDLREKFRRGV
ncbi:MAG: hypothetical protein HY277_07945 [Ignavibacteriales bacterium]|nr:hypothetical protein [Ignavibacteriales bacterium]